VSDSQAMLNPITGLPAASPFQSLANPSLKCGRAFRVGRFAGCHKVGESKAFVRTFLCTRSTARLQRLDKCAVMYRKHM